MKPPRTAGATRNLAEAKMGRWQAATHAAGGGKMQPVNKEIRIESG